MPPTNRRPDTPGEATRRRSALEVEIEQAMDYALEEFFQNVVDVVIERGEGPEPLSYITFEKYLDQAASEIEEDLEDVLDPDDLAALVEDFLESEMLAATLETAQEMIQLADDQEWTEAEFADTVYTAFTYYPTSPQSLTAAGRIQFAKKKRSKSQRRRHSERRARKRAERKKAEEAAKKAAQEAAKKAAEAERKKQLQPASDRRQAKDKARQRMADFGDEFSKRMKRIRRTRSTAATARLELNTLRLNAYTEKQWISHDDDRTRATHLAADRQVVGPDGSFTVGAASLEFPCDPISSDYGEIANCRCVLVGAGSPASDVLNGGSE